MIDNILLRLLRSLPPEAAHHAAVGLLKIFPVCNVLQGMDTSTLSQTCMGLHFPHPIGFAAGFDKDAEVFHKLGQIGFAFVEAGTITPAPQPGNPKPRVFRLPEKEAVINAYGFNSKGALFASRAIQQHPPCSILGVNLGINKNTLHPIEDYLKSVEIFIKLHQVDYFTINVSSPNTPGLRDLQKPTALQEIIVAVKNIISSNNRKLPLLVKLSPDMSIQEETTLIDFLCHSSIDGIIISNTTVARPGLEASTWQTVKGGLSGKPLKSLSTEMLSRAFKITRGSIPLIGCGGMSTGQDAYEKICAGANLLQMYTAFVYHGFSLLRSIILDLKEILEVHGVRHLSEVIGSQAIVNRP